MNKTKLGLLIVGLGVILGALIWQFVSAADKRQDRADTERDLYVRLQGIDPDLSSDRSGEESELLEPALLPWDIEDVDTTPPGIEPFIYHESCHDVYGSQIRRVCDEGLEAYMDEAGGEDLERRLVFDLCLTDVLDLQEDYRSNRPVSKKLGLRNSREKRSLTCQFTDLYGTEPGFDNWPFYYVVKEHIESAKIDRVRDTFGDRDTIGDEAPVLAKSGDEERVLAKSEPNFGPWEYLGKKVLTEGGDNNHTMGTYVSDDLLFLSWEPEKKLWKLTFIYRDKRIFDRTAQQAHFFVRTQEHKGSGRWDDDHVTKYPVGMSVDPRGKMSRMSAYVTYDDIAAMQKELGIGANFKSVSTNYRQYMFTGDGFNAAFKELANMAGQPTRRLPQMGMISSFRTEYEKCDLPKIEELDRNPDDLERVKAEHRQWSIQTAIDIHIYETCIQESIQSVRDDTFGLIRNIGGRLIGEMPIDTPWDSSFYEIPSGLQSQFERVESVIVGSETNLNEKLESLKLSTYEKEDSFLAWLKAETKISELEARVAQYDHPNTDCGDPPRIREGASNSSIDRVNFRGERWVACLYRANDADWVQFGSFITSAGGSYEVDSARRRFTSPRDCEKCDTLIDAIVAEIQARADDRDNAIDRYNDWVEDYNYGQIAKNARIERENRQRELAAIARQSRASESGFAALMGAIGEASRKVAQEQGWTAQQRQSDNTAILRLRREYLEDKYSNFRSDYRPDYNPNVSVPKYESTSCRDYGDQLEHCIPNMDSGVAKFDAQYKACEARNRATLEAYATRLEKQKNCQGWAKDVRNRLAGIRKKSGSSSKGISK